VYISLFACENSHYLCTGTRRQAEITRNLLRRLCRLLRAAGELLALDDTNALRCVPCRLATRLRPILQVARRVMPPVACGIFLGKREPARMRSLSAGRDVRNRVCVRGIRPNVWCVLIGTIPVARRLCVGRAEGRCLAAWAQTRGVCVCETEYGVSFVRPDCARIEEGIVWAKPDVVRTESLDGREYPGNYHLREPSV
jgi:hypothetical protein